MTGNIYGVYIDYEDAPVYENFGSIQRKGNDFNFFGIDLDIDLDELASELAT